jgi:hypothetical protein
MAGVFNVAISTDYYLPCKIVVISLCFFAKGGESALKEGQCLFLWVGLSKSTLQPSFGYECRQQRRCHKKTHPLKASRINNPIFVRNIGRAVKSCFERII